MINNYVISLPYIFKLSKKGRKKYFLSMNSYNKWHYQTKSKIKKLFTELAVEKLQDIPKSANIIELTYTVYRGDAHSYDLMNVVSVFDKFFEDSLTAAKVISDDNYKVVRKITAIPGGIDRENPRVEIRIREISL